MSNIIKLPSFADPHVHLREPGSEDKEDFFTGTCAALAGGYTTLLDMPNNTVPTISAEALEAKRNLAAAKIVCDVGFNFGATPTNASEYSKVAGQVAGLKAYLGHTHGSLVMDGLPNMLNIFRHWPPSPAYAAKPILIHAEGPIVAATIGLAALFDRKIHICHLSKRSELEVVRAAKERGLKVSCEVAPHHLFLTSAATEQLGSYAKMSPALQTADDVEALWQGLVDGTVDMLATDHAPHTRPEKDSPNPPFGVPGLETTFGLLYREVHQGRVGLSLERLVELLDTGPRRIFGLSANQGEVEVDLDSEYLFSNTNLFTKCGWTPFVDMPGRGSIRKVWLRGQLVFEENENGKKILAQPGFGLIF
jgi:carbamoyl-phosphate synthase/aspartate carbamoyltransferase/dihydroorotase